MREPIVIPTQYSISIEELGLDPANPPVPEVEIYTDADGKHTTVYVPEGVTILREPLEVDERLSKMVGR